MVWNVLGPILFAFVLVACSDETEIHRALRRVGPENLRAQTLATCREGFAANASERIPDDHWPEPVRAFKPMGLWAEPDGAYILIDTDAEGERGIYLPRILSEKDPLCSPTLKHAKLAEGVYWYDRKR
jgi:hypothetical protein